MGKPIFISHAGAELQLARDMALDMEAHGFSCWYDKRDIPVGENWAEAISAAINAARIMILIFSDRSNTSPTVQSEIACAHRLQLQILPFRIDRVQPAARLELFLSMTQWLDAFEEPRAQYFPQLRERIARLMSGPDFQAQTANAPAAALGAAFNPDDLRAVQLHLAQYIGPWAARSVSHAATQASSLGDLVDALAAAEIRGEQDRRAFLAACSPLTRRR